MRRKEFAVQEEAEMEAFLAEMSFGNLGTISEDGWPNVTPLNFVYHNGCFYMHGSRAGQKMKDMKASDRVTFAVAKEFALIPSYWKDPKLACPATAFFKSVVAKGRAELVSDLGEKAEALGAFMRKLQPEGGYATIDPADPDYAGELKAVAVIRVVPEDITCKFKFGQNWNEEAHETVSQHLLERGRELDAETAEMMKRYCPWHAQKAEGQSE